MDFNYILRYRTFNQLLEDVTVDLNTFALENMIEPQQLIKVAIKSRRESGNSLIVKSGNIMSKLFIGFILGVVVSSVGFSGIARMLDNGVNKVKEVSQEQIK